MRSSSRLVDQLVRLFRTTPSVLSPSSVSMGLMTLGEAGHRLRTLKSGACHRRSHMNRIALNCNLRLRGSKSHAHQAQTSSDHSLHSPAQHELDGRPFSFGKQKRRRGLQGSERTIPVDNGSTQPAAPPPRPASIPHSSVGQPDSNGSSAVTSGSSQREPVAMPPHLAASLDSSKEHRRRPIFGPISLPDQPVERGMNSRGSRDAEDRRTSQQGASTSAADVSETGDRAEGVLQIGASGARIPLYGRDVETILQAVNLDRRRLDSYMTEAPDEEDDMLEVTFDQLPKGHMKRDFDWSGQTNYAGMHRKVQEQRMRWHASRVSGSTNKIEMTLDGELVAVLPLWVAVFQETDGGLARLHESTFPLTPELVEELESELQPFCAVAGLRFEGCDQRSGPWRNYYVGIVGDVDSDEDDVLWPNQAIHGNRTIYNVRNGWDIARFLADAVKEDVEGHLGNLKRLQEERQYKTGWAYHMLRSRWGEPVLRKFDVRVDT